MECEGTQRRTTVYGAKTQNSTTLLVRDLELLLRLLTEELDLRIKISSTHISIETSSVTAIVMAPGSWLNKKKAPIPAAAASSHSTERAEQQLEKQSSVAQRGKAQ